MSCQWVNAHIGHIINTFKSILFNKFVLFESVRFG
jgi:hypothetical protein